MVITIQQYIIASYCLVGAHLKECSTEHFPAVRSASLHPSLPCFAMWEDGVHERRTEKRANFKCASVHTHECTTYHIPYKNELKSVY